MSHEDFCYICAEPLAGTPQDSEHVIPANLFERGRKTKGLITLPAHKSCNQSLSLDDEYFRLSMTARASPHDPVARKVWEGPTMRGFHRRDQPGLKIATLENLHSAEVQTPAGIYLGNADVLLQEAERIQRVVNRITRGLFAHLTGNVLPMDWPVACDLINPVAAKPVFDLLKIRLVPVGPAGVFEYGRGVLPTDERDGLFWMIFYGVVHFWGYTGNEIRNVLGVGHN